MRALLVYSHDKEPVTQALIHSDFSKKIDTIKISLEEFINNITVFDEFDHCKTKIHWTLSSGIEVHNSEEFYLINRVLSIPEDIFHDFSEEDQSYCIAELTAYFTFALEAFPVCFTKPGAFGLSGNRFSLPRQWEIVRQSQLLLEVPNYYLGNMNFSELEGEVIYSRPSNFYYWKPNSNLKDQTDFAFIKPKGIPIIACVLGNFIEFFFYDLNQKISEDVNCLLKDFSIKLLEIFKHSIAEILFFVDDGKITFGMISNVPYASKTKPWFSNLVSSFFENEIMQKKGTICSIKK